MDALRQLRRHRLDRGGDACVGKLAIGIERLLLDRIDGKADRRRPAAHGVDDAAQRRERDAARLPPCRRHDQPHRPAIEIGPRVTAQILEQVDRVLDEQAREELEVILRAYQEAIEREAEFNARAEGDAANKKTDRTPNALTEDWIGTWCLYGSPETVIEHLKPYQELGIGNILCGTTTGPLTEERLRLADQTLDLISQKVMPALSPSPAAA